MKRILGVVSVMLLAASPALADWNDVGTLTLRHGGERFMRDIPFGGPVEQLRLTSSGDDVFCRTVRATFGNGETRDVYHGLLRRDRPQRVDLPGRDRAIRRLSFQCGAQHADNAVLHVSADVGRYRDAWRRNPDFSRLWAKTFNWGSDLVNDWKYLGSEDFGRRGGRESRFAGWQGRHIDALALKPVGADARCMRVTAEFHNGRRVPLDVNRGDLLRQGQIYKLDLPGGYRNLDSLRLACRPMNGRRVTMQIFTSH